MTFIAFDLVGTLCHLDANGDAWAVFNKAGIELVLDKLSIHGEKREVLVQSFLSSKSHKRKLAKDTLQEFELKQQLIDFFLENNVEYDANKLVEYEVAFITPELSLTSEITHVKETLEQIKTRGLQTYVVSNNVSRELVEGILKKCDIIDLFDEIIVSSDCGWRKPHVKLAQHIEEITKEPITRGIFVGDRLTQDIAFANNHGMKSIFYSKFYHEDNDGAPQTPTFEVKEFPLIIDILKEL